MNDERRVRAPKPARRRRDVSGFGDPETAAAPGMGALVEFTVELDDPARDGGLGGAIGPAGSVEPDHVVEVRIILPEPG